jgi:hypothetical protein
MKRMSTSTSVFPFAHIALTAAITAGGALVVGLSVLVWRSAGNTRALNNDPIPGVSPNDVLCPLVTYLFLGFYAALQRPLDSIRFEQARMLLTLVSFVINVVTI